MTSHMIVPLETMNQSFHPVVSGVCNGTITSKKGHQMDRFNRMLDRNQKQSFYKKKNSTTDTCSSFFSLPIQDKHGSEKNTPLFLAAKHFFSKNAITKTLINPPFPLPYSLANNEEESVLSLDEVKQTTTDDRVYDPPFIYEKVLFNNVKYFPDLETAGAILWHSSNVYHRFPPLQKNDFSLPKKYFLSDPPIYNQCNMHSGLRPNTSF